MLNLHNDLPVFCSLSLSLRTLVVVHEKSDQLWEAVSINCRFALSARRMHLLLSTTLLAMAHDHGH